jgi:trans-2-enoyl-CoA reductase
MLNYFNFQIEREKCDLSVQVISLSERLEEAEGGAESQVMKTLTLMFFQPIKIDQILCF